MAKFIRLTSLVRFLSLSSAPGIILLACVALSLAIANSPLSAVLNNLLYSKVGVNGPGVHLYYPVITWINDGFMAVFFLLVGLEIKQEALQGALSSLRKAGLPVLAAIGGVVVPAMIYGLLNNNTATANGWGIPMATDIAFAVGILTLLGSRVPAGLKVLLTTLAVADDVIAIVVIALFYSSDIDTGYLFYAGCLFALQLIFNRLGFKNLLFYLLPGLVMWYFIHHSGIHATIAGVLTALAIPSHSGARTSPVKKLEHILVWPVNFIIMPLFAIANTNITFESGMAGGLLSNLGLGILLGLFVGKPAGIFIMSWLSLKLKIAQLPKAIKMGHIVGLGLLGGIGFTMSIFIALLSFGDAALQTEAKFAVLIASVISGTCGYWVLSKIKSRGKG